MKSDRTGKSKTGLAAGVQYGYNLTELLVASGTLALTSRPSSNW
ncbi:MAG: hypothetical protein ACLR7Z_05485 [Bilophila wadsworthia]